MRDCHRLKTWPEYFWDVKEGKKTFEVRKFDRDFKVGDDLVLQEWCPATAQYTGAELTRRIAYVLAGQCAIPGYAIMGLANAAPDFPGATP